MWGRHDSHGAVVDGARYRKTEKKPAYCTAFSANAYSAGRHRFRVKKVEIGSRYGRNSSVGVGVKSLPVDDFFGSSYKNKAYFYSDDGVLWNRSDVVPGSLPTFREAGSEVVVDLDCDAHTATFLLNGTTVGTLSHLPTEELYFFVQVSEPGDAWEMQGGIRQWQLLEEGGGSGGGGGAAPDPDEGKCKVCFVNPMDALLMPCRHLALCEKCAERVKDGTGRCPICKGHIDSIIKVFRSFMQSSRSYTGNKFFIF